MLTVTDTDRHTYTDGQIHTYTHTNTHTYMNTPDFGLVILDIRKHHWTLLSNNCPRDHQMFSLFPMIWVRDPLLTWSGNWKMVSPPPATHHQGNQKGFPLQSHMSFYIQKDNKFLEKCWREGARVQCILENEFLWSEKKRHCSSAWWELNILCWSRVIENQVWRADNDVTLLL